MLKRTLLFLSENGVARTVVTHAPFAKTVAHRFVAGETIDRAMEAAGEINELGMTVTMDYLGESVESRDDAGAAADIYIDVLDRLAADGIDGSISIKLTQIGQDIDGDFLRENVLRILDAAARHDTFVRFDMEDGEHTQPTLDFFRALWDEGTRHIGIVLQSYLHRTRDDARMANERGARVRLCKGAYKEPPSIAFQVKAEVDRNFVETMKLLLDDGRYPAIATHDEAMLDATRAYATVQGIDPADFEFQMLYGVRRDLQKQLVDQGYNMRVYLPFGAAWYPYLMRRMAERPANMFFVLNNVRREMFSKG